MQTSKRTDRIAATAAVAGSTDPLDRHGIEQPLPDHLPLVPPDAGTRGADDPEPEYPEAEAFVAARHFRSWHGSEDRQVRRIVIHVTAGQADYRRTVKYLQNPTHNGAPRPASAHYVIGQSGEVVQMVRHNDIAFHACSANHDSIGIEHVARPRGEWGRDDPGLLPTAAEYRSSARLVRFLCDRYELPLDREHIVGHVEADPSTSHTNCPDGAWDWDRFLDALGELE